MAKIIIIGRMPTQPYNYGTNIRPNTGLAGVVNKIT